MGKILPEYLSKWTTKKVENEGVQVITNCQVDDVEFKDDNLILQLSKGNTVSVFDFIYLFQFKLIQLS